MNKIIPILIILCLFCSNAMAQIEIELIKPIIDTKKILTKEETIIVKEYLKGKVFTYFEPAKNDYVDKFNRGTVFLNMTSKKAKNYSYQKVIIPDGSVVKEKNFSQDKAHSDVISGKDITFIGCNLMNVEIDPSWILVNSLTAHKLVEEEIIDGKTYKVIKIERNGKYEEDSREEIITGYITE